jgi:putative PIN family toxin of toxin-antitoxin system
MVSHTIPNMNRIVLDTNVLISAMRSNRGPAFRLVSLLGAGRFEISLSVGLAFEYESVLGRATPLNAEEIAELLDFLCSIAVRQRVFYLWRPMLRDPGDDLVLELAVASRSRAIVTFNHRDFAGSEQFGIEILSPARFLQQLGEDRWEP